MKMKAYLPDFSQAFEHFCIHTGGRGVIDGMEKQLNLPREAMQPTRDALYRFGNVSSSSIWCAPSWMPKMAVSPSHVWCVPSSLSCLVTVLSSCSCCVCKEYEGTFDIKALSQESYRAACRCAKLRGLCCGASQLQGHAQHRVQSCLPRSNLSVDHTSSGSSIFLDMPLW